MKKLFSFCILFVALTAIACKQPTGSNQPGSESQETVTPGWYLYTTNADSASPQRTYLYINTSGAIERAGSTQYEYTGSQLEMIQEQLSYTICKRNADGTVITFTTTEAPSWGKTDIIPEEITCPYPDGEYLDVTKHDTFSWPVNKNLQLWSAKESNYYSSCSDSFGYINTGNTFIVGAALSAGDSIIISMEDTDFNTFSCIVYFFDSDTSENNDNSNSDNSSEIELDTGYEWWCFEKAYINGNNKENIYVLYYNGIATRYGIDSYEISEISFLYKEKDSAIKNYGGTKYLVTDLNILPEWCY